MTPEAFRDRLKELGIAQRGLAAAWGCTDATISRWLHGKTRMPGWMPYALGLVSLGKPVEVITPVAAPVAPKPSTPTPPKPVDAKQLVPGRWRFGTFYPD